MAYSGTNIGSATGTFSVTTGTYTVTATGGTGIKGTSDSLYFVNQPVSGNTELIAQVVSQTGTNAYSSSGLMVSDLSGTFPAASQCAMIGVSPQNGVNFWYRTADNTVASSTLGPSLTAPIWLRLVVSLSSVAGYCSADGISWQLVGQCTLTLPSSYSAGFAVYSNVAGVANTATIGSVHQLTSVPQRVRSVLPNWTGTSVGVAPGSFVLNGDGSITVTAGGQGGVGGTSDNYYLVGQPNSGNIELTAYVASISNTYTDAFGGIMLNDLSSTYPVAPACVVIGVTYSDGTYFAYRTTDGATALVVNNSRAALPLWFRLTITAGAVNAYQSTDGINWTTAGTALMSFTGTVYLGLCVCSNTTTTNTVLIQSISAALSASMSTWLRSDVSVTYSGAAVSLWSDQSGVGTNATQGAVTNRPALVTNAINGLPAVNFNGTSSYLQFPTGFSDLSNGLSLFVVLKPSVVTALSQLLNLGTGSSNAYNLGLEINSSSEATYFVYDSTGATVTSVSLASAMTTSVQLIEVVQSGTSASIYLKGASVVTNNSMNNIPTPTAGRTANYLGQASAGGNYFNGQIAEVLLYHTALSTIDRQSVENYLISKYAL